MDLRLTAMIAIAHVRLRQTVDQHYPHLINEGLEMTKLQIKRPMELAGLKSSLARAQRQELTIQSVAKRYDLVQDGIDECIEASQAHAGDLEAYHGELRRKIESMVGSNGDPTSGQDGQDSGEQKVGQIIDGQAVGGQTQGEQQKITAADVGSLDGLLDKA